MSDDLLAAFRQHDRRALARLISQAARGERLDELRAQLGPRAKRSRVVALTGSAGVGKSTLIGKLIEQFRGQNKSIAVLACDPQSPLTGGALLGDRFRMPSRPDDAGVYIRSLAAAPGRQAVADHLDAIVFLCEHFGFDVVLIETVGSGQGDTAVRGIADGVVLLLQPETGDDLQWEKAGVLEVADIVVVHKADLPGADRANAQIQSMLALSAGREVPVLPVSSKTGAGLAELMAAVEALPPSRRDQDDRERLLKLVQHALAERFRADDMADIVAAWRAGLPTAEAVERVIRRLAGA
jgi:LAO/AO transport system ATPase